MFMEFRDINIKFNSNKKDLLVNKIKPIIKSTLIASMPGLKESSSLFKLPARFYKCPILVARINGVGTKLKIVFSKKDYSTIGIDLVAMCTNDLIAIGAQPLFFLDYYIVSELNAKKSISLIQGIATGCRLSGCSLIGGKISKIPNLYKFGEFDLIGFCVGIVDKDKLISKKSVTIGNCIIGLASSGLHSNGYSLINKLLKNCGGLNLKKTFKDSTLGELLLTPTKIYTYSMLNLLYKTVCITGIAHIKGSLVKNISKILPSYTKAVLNIETWEFPVVFKWIMFTFNFSIKEMLQTFNCGIGLIFIVKAEDYWTAIDVLNQKGEKAYLLGTIDFSENKKPYIDFVSK